MSFGFITAALTFISGSNNFTEDLVKVIVIKMLLIICTAKDVKTLSSFAFYVL